MTRQEKKELLDKFREGGLYAQDQERKAKNIRDKRYWQGRAYAYADCVETIKGVIVNEDQPMDSVSPNQLAFEFPFNTS